MIMRVGIGQQWIIAICLLTVCFITLVLTSKLKKLGEKYDSKRHVLMCITIIIISIIVPLLLNILFLWCSNHDIGILSELSYADSYSLLISILFSVGVSCVIAYLQYKIQRTLEDQNTYTKKMSDLHHNEEIRAAQIKSIDTIPRLNLLGINFIIPFSRIVYAKTYKEYSDPSSNTFPVLLLRLYSGDKKPLYPQNIKIKRTNTLIDDFRDDLFLCKCFSDHIDVVFLNSINKNIDEKEHIDDFLLSPLRDDEKDRKRMNVVFECNAEDTGYITHNNGNNKEKAFHSAHTHNNSMTGEGTSESHACRELCFRIALTLLPEYGYQEDGTFHISIHNSNIELIRKEVSTFINT